MGEHVVLFCDPVIAGCRFPGAYSPLTNMVSPWGGPLCTPCRSGIQTSLLPSVWLAWERCLNRVLCVSNVFWKWQSLFTFLKLNTAMDPAFGICLEKSLCIKVLHVCDLIVTPQGTGFPHPQ